MSTCDITIEDFCLNFLAGMSVCTRKLLMSLIYQGRTSLGLYKWQNVKKPRPFWRNMKYQQRDLVIRQQTNCHTISWIPFLQRLYFISFIAGVFFFVVVVVVVFWGVHSPTNKIQHDNRTSMQWPSFYNRVVYHIPRRSIYEQFLRLLNLDKACSD